MKNSIRYKLFAVFLGLLTIFITIFLISSFFLDDIFIWENKRIMEDAYEKFDNTSQNRNINEGDLIELVESIGGNITILTPELNLKISTSRYEDNINFTNIDIIEQIEILKRDEDKKFTSMVTENIRGDNKSIFFIGKLKAGGYFIGEKAIKEIQTSTQIARVFLGLASIGTLLIGSVIVYFLSKKLTKPITEITQVAGEISKLNFDKKVNVDSEDEIGLLASSINNISDKLNKVLTELRNDIEREKQLEKMRRNFISNVSHELKTPLSMIAGYTEGLKYNIAKEKADKDYYYDVIIDETDKMNLLIEELLELSSYESGNFSIKKENINISDLLNNTIEKYKLKLNERQVKLHLKIKENVYINADKLRIEQVITNFLDNMIKYVEQNGNIKIELEESENNIKLLLYNSGEKIEESEIKNIWESFYKAEKSKKGTGLGLSIIRAIIELHGGSYGVENKDYGVEFFVTLPK